MRRRRKKRKEIKFKQLVQVVLVGLLLAFFVRVWFWWHQGWNRQSQINLAVEGRGGKILILSLTPAKSLVTGLIIPANLVVETPWFGRYQAAKLSLLANQEGKPLIFNRSLSYFLPLALDQGWLGTDLDLEGEPKRVARGLRVFFAPWRRPSAVKFWLFLRRKDLVWQWFDLSQWSQSKTLPDGTQVLELDRERFGRAVLADLTDPLVKNEAITIGVFNVGQQSGLAQRTARLIEYFGGRVIEIGDREVELNDCLIILRHRELKQTHTFARLQSVLSCRWQVVPRESGEGMAEIQILVKSVKI